MDKGYHQPGAWAVIYCATTGKFLMGKRSAKVNKAGAWNQGRSIKFPVVAKR